MIWRVVAGLNGVALLWVALAYAVSSVEPGTAAAMLPFTADSYASDLSMQAGHLLDSVGQPDQAIRLYRTSLRWDPGSTPNWLLLAGAEERRGNPAGAWDALENALRHEPRSPEVLWTRANYLLRADRKNEAISDCVRLLQATRRFDEPVFQMLAQSIGIAPASHRLPKSPEVQNSFLRFALKVDARVTALELHSSFGSLSEVEIEALCRRLLAEGAGERTWRAWREWFQARTGSAPSDLLRNGGFERETSAPPFDWRLTSDPAVQVFRDGASPRTGSTSLQMRFNGKVNFSGILADQWSRLAPNRYSLRLWWKAQGLSSDSMPGIRVVDAETGATLADVLAAPGTWPWKQEAIECNTTSIATVRIEVYRRASGGLAGEISGSLWLDDVSFEAVQ